MATGPVNGSVDIYMCPVRFLMAGKPSSAPLKQGIDAVMLLRVSLGLKPDAKKP